MTGTTCFRHPFELSANVCCSCGHDFCGDCLVYPRGGSKPPLCVSCAVAAAGVRSTARINRAGSKREVKRRVRNRRETGYVPPDVYAATRDPFGLKLAGWAGPAPATEATPAPGLEPAAVGALPTVYQGGAPRPEREPEPAAAPDLGFDVSGVLSPPERQPDAAEPSPPALDPFAVSFDRDGDGAAADPAGPPGTAPEDFTSPAIAASWFDGPPDLAADPGPASFAPTPTAIPVGFDEEIVPMFDEAPPWAVADLDLDDDLDTDLDDEDEPFAEAVSVPRLRVAAPLRRDDHTGAPGNHATDDTGGTAADDRATENNAGTPTRDNPFAPEPPKVTRRPTLAPLPGAPPALPFASPRPRRDDPLHELGSLPSAGS